MGWRPVSCWRILLVAAALWGVASAADSSEADDGGPGRLWQLPIIGPTCDSSAAVCGENGVVFESACDAIAAGVRIVEAGACAKETKEASPCSVKCFRADPVCGEDGVTYWCGEAEAACAGVEIAHAGFCDFRSGGVGEKAARAAQSLFLVHLVWLVLAGFLVMADLT